MYHQPQSLNELLPYLKVLLRTLEFHEHKLDEEESNRISSAIQNTIEVVEQCFEVFNIGIDFDLIDRDAAERKPSHYMDLQIVSQDNECCPILPRTLNRFQLMCKLGSGAGVFESKQPINCKIPFNPFEFQFEIKILKNEKRFQTTDKWSLFKDKVSLLRSFNRQGELLAARKSFILLSLYQVTISTEHSFMEITTSIDGISTKAACVLHQEMYLRTYRNLDRNIYVIGDRFILFIRSNLIILLDAYEFLVNMRRCTSELTSKTELSGENIAAFKQDPQQIPTEAIFFNESEQYLYSISIDGKYYVRKFRKIGEHEVFSFDSQLDFISQGRFPVKGYEEYTAICASEGLVAAAAFNTALFRVRLSVSSALSDTLITSCYYKSENPVYFMQLVRHENALLLLICGHQGKIKTFIFHDSKLIESKKEKVTHINALEFNGYKSDEAFSFIDMMKGQRFQMRGVVDRSNEMLSNKIELLDREIFREKAIKYKEEVEAETK